MEVGDYIRKNPDQWLLPFDDDVGVIISKRKHLFLVDWGVAISWHTREQIQEE